MLLEAAEKRGSKRDGLRCESVPQPDRLEPPESGVIVVT